MFPVLCNIDIVGLSYSMCTHIDLTNLTQRIESPLCTRS